MIPFHAVLVLRDMYDGAGTSSRGASVDGPEGDSPHRTVRIKLEG